jgi:uridine kinase
VIEGVGGVPAYFPDIRLMRRLIRDSMRRGYSMEQTLMHWHLVRKGERFLLPYLHSADEVIDTGLPYELPVLKLKLEGRLRAILPMFERNPDLFDGAARAKRILNLFSEMTAARPGQLLLIPDDSILREFIGGSRFFDKK